jgi:hypothetical protein
VGGGATAGAPTSYSVVITNSNNHLHNVGFALEGSAASQFCFNVSTIQLLAFVLGGAMIHAPTGDSITSHT